MITLALFIAANLTFYLVKAQKQQTPVPDLPTLDVRADFGARGDGHTDNTRAFARLSREINRRGGGVRVVIPPGEYLVGGQIPNGHDSDGNVCRFAGIDVLALHDCARRVRIEAIGAVVRLPDHLKFGSFASTSLPLRAPLPFYDLSAAATTGFLISAVRCADVSVVGLELDGRNTSYELGGEWGDKDRQCRSYGFYFESCKRVELANVSSHNFGLDGLYIKAPGLRATDASAPHTIHDSRFEWNGRQGLSWSGGTALRATNCVFAHTGYAQNEAGQAISNAPGAGVDIEAEQSVCRNGEFVNCQFTHTRGPALYVQTGDNADAKFQGCTFWNFANYSLVPDAPRLSFSDCQILGAATSAYSSTTPNDATRFEKCTFEDRPHPQWGKTFSDAYGSLIAFDNLTEGLTFDDCNFVAHSVKGPFLRAPRADQTRGFLVQGGTLRLEHWNAPDENLATFQGGQVNGLHIETGFDSPPVGLHIWTNRQTTFTGATQLNSKPLDTASDRLLLTEVTP